MNKKQKRNLIRIIISSLLFILSFMFPLNDTIKLGIYLLSYVIIGYDVLLKAIRNIFCGKVFDENFLMSLATIVAFLISEYPEAVIVMLFYQIGELFQSVAVGKSRKSITSLMDIKPDYANVLRNNKEVEVSPDDVKIGEIIVVRPGEKIPLDGIIVEGTTLINTSMLTGESLPKNYSVSENVISGSINIKSLIKIRVTSPFTESTVTKILELVENSASKKAKTENFISRFAKYYTPCVVISAVLLATIPPLLFSGEFNEWINRALIFLVVSCPCALVISVPLSFFGGIGGASKSGILIKGANYLEALSSVHTIVFDKTGTLTHGNFEVTKICPSDISKEELLDIAAIVESYSNHPIAESIVRAHIGHIDKNRVKDITEISGMGIKATIDGKTVLAGNDKLIKSENISYNECREHTGTIVHVAVSNKYCGHIVISDKIKNESKNIVSSLKEIGVAKTVMLTGDSKKVGEAVGKEVKIDEIYAELLPGDKVSIVEKLLDEKKEKATLAFVGDGINDAPVLTRADIGIAMGALGSDAAIEAADIVLMDDNPLKIALAIKISRKTMNIVKQNITFALLVKAIVLVLGACGIANMWFAVFSDVGVTILAILNAIRALKIS